MFIVANYKWNINILKVKSERNIARKHLKETFNHQQSPYTFGVVMADKKDGNKRFCIDFRRHNDITGKDSFPFLLKTDDILDSLADQKQYSTIDFAARYWLLELAESYKEKTAFRC
jgi:hypothetical protein